MLLTIRFLESLSIIPSTNLLEEQYVSIKDDYYAVLALKKVHSLVLDLGIYTITHLGGEHTEVSISGASWKFYLHVQRGHVRKKTARGGGTVLVLHAA